ncbi:hypothetical protein JR334_11565 [Clostridia bacterium]|nr:hypothetical protein JR334_11565 [Clostridia bacterium]
MKMKNKSLSIVLVVLFVALCFLTVKVIALEKEMKDYQKKWESLEEGTNIEVVLEAFEGLDIRQMHSDLTYLQASTEVLNDLVLNKDAFTVYVGRGIEGKADFQSTDGTIVELDFHPDARTFVVGQYSYVEEDIKNFIENILYYPEGNSTIIVVDGKVKYLFQGNLLE